MDSFPEEAFNHDGIVKDEILKELLNNFINKGFPIKTAFFRVANELKKRKKI
jgi:hypothetical protein